MSLDQSHPQGTLPAVATDEALGMWPVRLINRVIKASFILTNKFKTKAIQKGSL
jgi:hypothetical protein